MPPGSVVSTDNGVPVIAVRKVDIEKWLRNNTFFKRVNQKWNITPLETTKNTVYDGDKNLQEKHFQG